MIDDSALFKIGYGLYVITSNDGTKDNGMICNSVMQVANSEVRIAVSINKANYTHDVVKKTGKMNLCVLAESATFSLFQLYGFKSGRNANKLAGVEIERSENGLAVLKNDCNAFISLSVQTYTDLGSHGLFICTITESKTLSSAPTMSYAFYHANVKPKPKPQVAKKGFVCSICGYVYEGDELPADFICPICKHPASVFTRL